MDAIIAALLALLLIVGCGGFGYMLLMELLPRKRVPLTEREQAALPQVGELLEKGERYCDILRATGLSKAELDNVIRARPESYVIWMWLRGVDGHEIVRRSPYNARATYAIVMEFETGRKEGRYC